MTQRLQYRTSIFGICGLAAIGKLLIASSVLITACLVFSTTLHAQCTRCCFPYPNLAVSPTIAEEAQPVVLTTRVQNCLSYARVITVKVNVTPPTTCASFAEAFSITVYVPRLQGRTVSYTFSAPNCDGRYKVIDSVSGVSGSATAYFTVN